MISLISEEAAILDGNTRSYLHFPILTLAQDQDWIAPRHGYINRANSVADVQVSWLPTGHPTRRLYAVQENVFSRDSVRHIDRC